MSTLLAPDRIAPLHHNARVAVTADIRDKNIVAGSSFSITSLVIAQVGDLIGLARHV